MLRGDSIFLWYLEAKARSAESLDAMVKAAVCPHLDPGDYKTFRQNLEVLRSGPGRLVSWEDTLTDAQKAGLKKAQEAQARTLEKLKRHGKLSETGEPQEPVAGGRMRKRFGRRKTGD